VNSFPSRFATRASATVYQSGMERMVHQRFVGEKVDAESIANTLNISSRAD